MESNQTDRFGGGKEKNSAIVNSALYRNFIKCCIFVSRLTHSNTFPNILCLQMPSDKTIGGGDDSFTTFFSETGMKMTCASESLRTKTRTITITRVSVHVGETRMGNEKISDFCQSVGDCES